MPPILNNGRWTVWPSFGRAFETGDIVSSTDVCWSILSTGWVGILSVRWGVAVNCSVEIVEVGGGVNGTEVEGIKTDVGSAV